MHLKVLKSEQAVIAVEQRRRDNDTRILVVYVDLVSPLKAPVSLLGMTDRNLGGPPVGAWTPTEDAQSGYGV